MYCGRCGHNNKDRARFCANCGIAFQPVMGEPRIQKGSTTIPAVQYASLWMRVIAAIIDGILVYTISLALYLLLIFIVGVIYSGTEMGWEIVIMGVSLILILSPIYFAVMESSSKQATLGKMTLGIIVTDCEGKRISFWRSVLRNVGKIVSAATYGILLLVSCITVIFTQKKQALYDMIAGCCVMKKMSRDN